MGCYKITRNLLTFSKTDNSNNILQDYRTTLTNYDSDVHQGRTILYIKHDMQMSTMFQLTVLGTNPTFQRNYLSKSSFPHPCCLAISE